MMTDEEELQELARLSAQLKSLDLDPSQWLAAGLRERFIKEIDAAMKDKPWKRPKPAVHHLHSGVAACANVTPALRGLPKDWPAGHLWSADWGDVTCIACLLHAPGPL